jgi:hypothetical protein
MQENLEMNSRERQQLESSISNMNKELKLKWVFWWILEVFFGFCGNLW